MMKRICIALALALGAAGSLAGQQGVLLTGVVIDASNGQPLRSARVRVPAARVDVFTDVDGRFIAENVAPGTYGAVVSLLGYRQAAVIWNAGEPGPEPVVALQPNPVLLAAINVTTGRLERRVRASGAAAEGFGRDLLVTSNDRDAAIFVRQMAHLVPAPCATFAIDNSDLNCLRVRGASVAPCVLIDDSPSSFGELALYRPRELYRVDVYRGGEAILAYTTSFAEQLALRGWNPPPLETQVEMYCRKSASLN
jgi:hypothetical protein